MAGKITKVKLALQASKSPDYYRGLKDALDYLSEEGNGIGGFRELLNEVSEATAGDQEPLSFKIPKNEIQ